MFTKDIIASEIGTILCMLDSFRNPRHSLNQYYNDRTLIDQLASNLSAVSSVVMKFHDLIKDSDKMDQICQEYCKVGGNNGEPVMNPDAVSNYEIFQWLASDPDLISEFIKDLE